MTFGKRRPTSSELDRARVDDSVPVGMRIAGAWSWRILALSGVIALFIFLVMQLSLIVIPIMVSVLIAALLVPIVRFLTRHRWPKWLAVVVAIVGLVAVVSGLVYLIIWQIRAGLPDLIEQSLQAWDDFTAYLSGPPFNLDQDQLSNLGAQLFDYAQEDNNVFVTGAVSVGSSAGHFLAGLFLTFFITIIMLVDGRGVWNWLVRLFPRKARPAIDGSGRAGWNTLSQFVRVQIVVAAIDAVGIGLGAWILQLPLVLPIAIAVFLGAFIPFVGAIVTGALAVFIALIFKDVVIAIIMLGIILLVQQLESHVLQPLIMGNAVKVHPLAVVLAVAAGGFLAGIPGALFAVPVVASLNSMISYIAKGRWRAQTGALDPHVIAEAGRQKAGKHD